MLRRGPALLLAALTAVGFCQANAVLVWLGSSDAPRQSDVIVALGGDNEDGRLNKAIALVHSGYAPVLLTDLPFVVPRCRVPGISTVCFAPSPSTTRGEARAVSAMARSRGWRSLTVVVSQDQAVRARLRFRRCFDGRLRIVTVPTPRSEQLQQTLYQDAALIKAEVWQRGC